MAGTSVADVGSVTKQYVGQKMGIFIDDEAVSTPVLREPIESGNCVISGNLTRGQARHLAALLNGGPLPVKVVAVP
jgi:preprotein translocase subunit SecD